MCHPLFFIPAYIVLSTAMEKKAAPAAIERYLLQRMSPEEQQDFETRLRNEPALVAELAFYEALSLHRDQQLKNRWAAKGQALLLETDQPQGVSSAQADHPTAQSTTRVRPMFAANPYRWAIAATFALLVVAAGIWYVSAQQDVYGRLYSAQYERLNSSTQLSTSIETPDQQTWNQAFSQYTAKEYDAALRTAGSLAASPDYRNPAHLLSGACYLEQNRPQEAIREFQQVDRDALSLYQKARFNIALAYIQAHDAQAAKTQLQQITKDPENRYGGKAEELLKALEKAE
jgi:hypothetical protein